MGEHPLRWPGATTTVAVMLIHRNPFFGAPLFWVLSSTILGGSFHLRSGAAQPAEDNSIHSHLQFLLSGLTKLRSTRLILDTGSRVALPALTPPLFALCRGYESLGAAFSVPHRCLHPPKVASPSAALFPRLTGRAPIDADRG